jgi:glycosyltransferase involved in cell wall biosynthesis
MVANGWDNRKNPKNGLLAFQKLREKINGAKLKLFGNGFGKGEIADRWATKLGIAEGIEFMGVLPYKNLLDEMAKGDLLLHPSLEESFGMVIAEAMALGLPIVGGRKSGAVPWVIGEAGILVDMLNPTEIASGLEFILTNPSQWEALRAIAYRSSRLRFSSHIIATEYENLYYKKIEEINPCY